MEKTHVINSNPSISTSNSQHAPTLSRSPLERSHTSFLSTFHISNSLDVELTGWEVRTESTFGGGDEGRGGGEEGLKRVVGGGRRKRGPFGTRVEGFESCETADGRDRESVSE